MKKDEVPGKRQRDKVGYLDKLGKSVKEIAEILEMSTASVYQNKSELRKESKRNEMTDPFATSEETPWELPNLLAYEEPTPVHKIIEEKAPTFEIGLDNMDGATVKALIAIANNKLDNDKIYKISLCIEEK